MMNVNNREAVMKRLESGKVVHVSSSVGFLEVRRLSKSDEFQVEWRFDRDTAWAQILVRGGRDVIEEICDEASDVYRRTGQRKQAPNHPRYVRESMEKIVPKSLPIVFDPNCPPDYEHEAYGVLFVGLKSKQTHVVTEIVQDYDTRRILSVKTAEIAKAKPVYEKGWPKGPLTSLPSLPMKFIGGAAWTGVKAEEMMRGGRTLIGPLTFDEFPNIPGVPKPDYAWGSIDGELHYRDAYGRSTQITSKAIRSTFEVDAATVTDGLLRAKGAANKARGNLKHGPYGSGEAGPCDVDCAKCAHEKLSAMKRDSEPLPVVFDRDCPRDYEDEAFGVRWVGVKKKATHEIVRIVGDEHGRPTKVETRPIDREAASAAWSAQLRGKIAERKEREAEAARYTPYWSPEEQQGGDL